MPQKAKKTKVFQLYVWKNRFFFGSKNNKNIFFKKTSHWFPLNFIAVILKKNLVQNKYPDSLTFFWNDARFCSYTDYWVSRIRNFFLKMKKAVERWYTCDLTVTLWIHLLFIDKQSLTTNFCTSVCYLLKALELSTNY